MSITIDHSKYLGISGVYSIYNEISGYVYDGSAICLYSRIKNHRNSLKRGTHRNKHLQNSFNKYGEDAFIVWINVITTNNDGMINGEQYYIDLHKLIGNSFNINPIAGNNLGYKHTEETKKHLSSKKIGKLNPQYGNIGDKNPNSKLTWDDINFIRENKNNYSYAELGRIFGVAYQNISSIIKYKTWKND